MWRASMPYGRKGLAVHALSAVDLALWDLLGQLRGESSPRVAWSSSTLILSSSHPRLPAFAIRRRDSPYEAQSGRARTTCNRLGEPVYALLGGRTKVGKTPRWPRSWANFSLLQMSSHKNAWANLHLLGQPDTCRSR
jgi:hypothetical protein